MKILCKIGLHRYDYKFIPFADQPFLTGNIEDELCDVEGKYVEECTKCGERKDK